MADGDDGALGELFDRYAPATLALLQAILGPSYEAQEQLHELFLELWRSAPSWGLQAPQPLRGWLLLRARQRALAILAEAPELSAEVPRPRLLPPGAKTQGRFDGACLDDPHLGRLRARQRRALRGLSKQARLFMSLSYLRGLKGKALAERVGEPTREANRRLAFAYQALFDNAHDEGQEA